MWNVSTTTLERENLCRDMACFILYICFIRKTRTLTHSVHVSLTAQCSFSLAVNNDVYIRAKQRQSLPRHDDTGAKNSMRRCPQYSREFTRHSGLTKSTLRKRYLVKAVRPRVHLFIVPLKRSQTRALPESCTNSSTSPPPTHVKRRYI